MRDDEVQANLKIPRELRDQLKEAAKNNRRSMTAEVVARLESSFLVTGNGAAEQQKVPAKVWEALREAVLREEAERKNEL